MRSWIGCEVSCGSRLAGAACGSDPAAGPCDGPRGAEGRAYPPGGGDRSFRWYAGTAHRAWGCPAAVQPREATVVARRSVRIGTVSVWVGGPSVTGTVTSPTTEWSS